MCAVPIFICSYSINPHQNLVVQMHPSVYIMSVNSAMPANFGECFLDIVPNTILLGCVYTPRLANVTF